MEEESIGPCVSVPAVKQALSVYSNLNLITYGREKDVLPLLRDLGLEKNQRLDFIHTDKVVSSNDAPLQILRQKQQTSMWLSVESVLNKKALGAVSCGNTGALVAISNHLLGTLPSVHRCALVKTLPSLNKYGTVFLDLGANINADAKNLYQYAVMGSILAKSCLGVESPRVALLNVGKEENKGTKLIREAYALISADSAINFIGFAEGSDLFTDFADVIVSDGFSGNIALKTAEGLYKVIESKIRGKNSRYFFLKPLKYFLKKRIGLMQPDKYNGSTLLGLNGVVVKSHGGANYLALANAIGQAVEQCESNVSQKIVNGLTQ